VLRRAPTIASKSIGLSTPFVGFRQGHYFSGWHGGKARKYGSGLDGTAKWGKWFWGYS